MLLSVVWVTVIGILLGIVSSAIRVPLIQFSPDINLIFLSVIVAEKQNATLSILSGFFIGWALDIMSLAPQGFHALIFCLIGYASSQLYPLIHIGRVLLACFMAASATFMKYLLSWLVSNIFQTSYVEVGNLFSLKFLWEWMANSIMAPIMFVTIDFLTRLFFKNRRDI